MNQATIPNLSSLIEMKKFNYVNSDITEKLFPFPKEVGNDYKLFHFDRHISSEDAIKEMEKEGYRAANIYELLLWPNWEDKDWVVALGSVGEVGGDRHVPCLDRNDSKRDLDLYWWGDGWNADYRFLGVRNLSSEPKNLGSLPLELMSLRHLDRIEEKLDKLMNHLGIK